jgi:hypothetical protein
VAQDLPRRRAAGIPGDLELTTKPQLAIGQLRRLKAAGLPARWTAADEVYGRGSAFRQACQECGLAYVVIIPCAYLITTSAGTAIRADQAAADAVFERRSCGTGTPGVSPNKATDFDGRCALPGMRMVVRAWPADVGDPWFCETVQQIDAGVPSFGCPPVAS